MIEYYSEEWTFSTIVERVQRSADGRTNMALQETLRAIGLMSGTSGDGIDVAYIESNGSIISCLGNWGSYPYSDDFRKQLKVVNASSANYQEIENRLTLLHYHAVQDFLNANSLNANEVDLVGFHGHTIYHNPTKSISIQIGNGKHLAELLNITVFHDFRTNDILHGGQGAPLTPIFHSKLAEKFEKPVVVLNLGGVANVTWIGEGNEDLLAFDTGPGNAMLDDWIFQHDAGAYDVDGNIAASGSANQNVLKELLNHSYFERDPPKSLDRNEFSLRLLKNCSLEEGAATLSAFSVETVKLSQTYFPRPVKSWIVCGGGRHNDYILSELRERLEQPVLTAEDIEWQGDAIEAQAFAYLAIRSRFGLPISFPNTTGVKIPLTGGKRADP